MHVHLLQHVSKKCAVVSHDVEELARLFPGLHTGERVNASNASDNPIPILSEVRQSYVTVAITLLHKMGVRRKRCARTSSQALTQWSRVRAIIAS